jgi:hypothetical protein
LTPTEYALFWAVLADNVGSVVPHDTLLDGQCGVKTRNTIKYYLKVYMSAFTGAKSNPKSWWVTTLVVDRMGRWLSISAVIHDFEA